MIQSLFTCPHERMNLHHRASCQVKRYGWGFIRFYWYKWHYPFCSSARFLINSLIDSWSAWVERKVGLHRFSPLTHWFYYLLVWTRCRKKGTHVTQVCKSSTVSLLFNLELVRKPALDYHLYLPVKWMKWENSQSKKNSAKPASVIL